MLRDYEILYIVRPELDEDAVGEATRSVETLIKNLGGEHDRTDVWGRRRLAYEVRHLREGTYVLTDFKLEAERVKEMEATLKISDTVFRHLITRKPEKAKRAAQDGRAEPPTAEAPVAEDAPEPEAVAAVVEPEAAEPEPDVEE